MLFDIRVGGKQDNGVTYHHPVVPPLPIKPYSLPVSAGQSAGLSKSVWVILSASFQKPFKRSHIVC